MATKQEPYDVGDAVVLAALWTDVNGYAAAPTDVVLSLRKPGGTLVTVPLADLDNPVLGTYQYEYTVDEAGRWHYRWQATGNEITLVGEDHFTVRKSSVL